MPSDSADTAPYRTTAEKDELLVLAGEVQKELERSISAAVDPSGFVQPYVLAANVIDALWSSSYLTAEPADAQMHDAALQLLYTAAQNTGVRYANLEKARQKAQDGCVSLAMDMGLDPAVVFLLRVSLERQNTGSETMTWTKLTDSVTRARESGAQVDNLSRELAAVNPGSSALPRGTAAAQASLTTGRAAPTLGTASTA